MADIIESGEHLGIRWKITNPNWGYEQYIHYVFSNIRQPQSNFKKSFIHKKTLYILNEKQSPQLCIDEIERIVSLYEQGGQKYLNAKQQIDNLIQST
jgi:hypothetical protein